MILTVEIEFTITKETDTIFELALLLSGEEKNDVIERLIHSYAKKVLLGKVEAQSNNNSVRENEQSSPSSRSKAYRRFEGWAKKTNQINHQVLKAFFLCEKDGTANRNVMREKFMELNPDKASYLFDGNLNSMATEAGNSHGRAFVFQGENVTLAEDIRKLAAEHRGDFLSSK